MTPELQEACKQHVPSTELRLQAAAKLSWLSTATDPKLRDETGQQGRRGLQELVPGPRCVAKLSTILQQDPRAPLPFPNKPFLESHGEVEGGGRGLRYAICILVFSVI